MIVTRDAPRPGVPVRDSLGETHLRSALPRAGCSETDIQCIDGSAAKARCRVLAFTGMRPSELMRYRPEHWDRETQTLVVLTGKGGRTRTIPLSTPAVEALEALESLGAIGPFSTSTVRRAFVRAAERLGFHGVRPYDLRHSFGTALYRAAGDTRSSRTYWATRIHG